MRLLSFLILLLNGVNGAKILCFFYFPSVSHQYVLGQIARELSVRGHEVTFVTPNPLKDLELKNLTEIDVSAAYGVFKNLDLYKMFNIDLDFMGLYLNTLKLNEAIIYTEMKNQEVRKLLQMEENYFDLVLIEAHDPFLYGFQHKFKVPLIAVSSLAAFTEMHNVLGNSIHPVLYSDMIAPFERPVTSLVEKFKSLLYVVEGRLLYDFYIYPARDAVAREYFGYDMPYIKDLMRETSMLMINMNPILSDKRPNVPNVIEFHNVHINRKDNMTEDLKQILDNAKEGVVYFSLGTNVRFDHVEGDMKKTILEALGDLPYTVICKWESESVPDQPKNIHLRKWFPQQAVLAHPNIKLFVTQGGLQSSEEAIINSVPLVVIPFLGDQPLNAKILTSNGMAETISPKDLNRKILKDTILKVAKGEKYKTKAKELRDIFLDQPQSGIDKVIWWCEYVIRHKGAKHLRSPAADISLYEYFMLDVIGVILVVLYAVYKVLRLLIHIAIALAFKSNQSPVANRRKRD